MAGVGVGSVPGDVAPEPGNVTLTQSDAGEASIDDAARAPHLGVLLDVRSPHHYRVERFAPLFLPWLGWQLLGFGAIWERVRDRGRPAFGRLFGVLAGYWLSIPVLR